MALDISKLSRTGLITMLSAKLPMLSDAKVIVQFLVVIHSFVIPSVSVPNVRKLSVVMLSVIMLSVVMLIVVMLSVEVSHPLLSFQVRML
jgi:hypothetical protein